MAFRLHDEFASQGDEGDEIGRLRQILENGLLADQRAAAEKLVELRAEAALTECLTSSKSTVVQLATGGLWECWLNEQGPKPRREMEKGVKLMNDGELGAALRIFERLVEQF